MSHLSEGQGVGAWQHVGGRMHRDRSVAGSLVCLVATSVTLATAAFPANAAAGPTSSAIESLPKAQSLLSTSQKVYAMRQ